MKQLIVTLFISAMSAISVYGQMDSFSIKKADTNILQTVKLDFAVPDIPAFKALGTDPSQILRPSSPKELALAVSNFRSGGQFVIPQNLAVEVTPGLLIKPWYTLNEYQKKGFIRWVSKLSLSAGSDRDQESGTSSLAFGFRSVIMDKGDFRLDRAFLDSAIYKRQDSLTKVLRDKRNAYLTQNNMTIRDFAMLPQKTQDSILEIARAQAIEQIGFDLDEKVAEAMQEFKKKNWNAPRMDLAYSFVLQSPDSLISTVKLNKHLIWFAWAFRPGKNDRTSQFILGFNNSAYKADGSFYNEFTGNFRYYIGRNRLKGFAEAQYQNLDHPMTGRTETLYAQIGVEVAVYKSIWLHFGTGVLNALDGTSRSQLKSNLNLYFTFPENLKLF